MPNRRVKIERIKANSKSLKTRGKNSTHKMAVYVAAHPKNAYIARSIVYGKIYAQEKHEIDLMTSGLQRFVEKTAT